MTATSTAGQAAGATPVTPPAERDALALEGPWRRPLVRYLFLLLVGSLTFVADQLSKSAIKVSKSPGDVIPVLPPVFDLHYITNRGVAFGLFSRFGDVFVPVAIVIMSTIFWYYRSLTSRRLWLRLALGMQLGGALGNLLDRLRFGSAVDFMEFHIDPINFHWPVFNVADSAIVVGVGILLVCLTFQHDG